MAMNKWCFKILPLSVVVSGALLSGCATQANGHNQANACQVGFSMAQTTLYFGMSRPHGADITQAQWQSFVDQEVTPRFRDGLTVFNAKGQWLGNDGKVAREGSRALMLIHSKDDAKSNQAIEDLRQIYKTKFEQESVMRVDSTQCVSF